MDYPALSPQRVLALGFTAPELAERSWSVDWTTVAEPADLCARTLPAEIDFHTSGSTGPARTWRRLRRNLWLEAGMLADLIAPDRPEAVVSFVPTVHLFGALTGVLVPAHLGVPVWCRPGYVGALPAITLSTDTAPQRRIAVIATPWIFQLLLDNLAWVRGFEHVTVLYGGAMLPATAGEFLRAAGPELATIVEVMGSTEAGGFATRRWSAGDPPQWTLFPDVTFATATGGEGPLLVHSARLAFRPGEQPPARWEADDIVVPTGDRTFRLVGRTGRLVKVNGRRINLDDAEHAVRAVLDCADLALIPIADDKLGEHLELHLVPKPGTTLSDVDLRTAFRHLGVRPKRVREVPEIHRSALGKRTLGKRLDTEEAEVVTP